MAFMFPHVHVVVYVCLCVNAYMPTTKTETYTHNFMLRFFCVLVFPVVDRNLIESHRDRRRINLLDALTL